MAGDSWTKQQVEAAVLAYRDMLRLELEGSFFNKAERNRMVQAATGRVRGGVERKHQNISSILRDIGMPYVDGYKPLGNRQKLLEDLVLDIIAADSEINTLAQIAVEREQFPQPAIRDFLGLQVEAPRAEKGIYSKLNESPTRTAPRVGTDYVERESRNRALGLAGEELVLEFEHQRLWQAGEKKLAERIEHVAATRGDGLGYDILSFEVGGRERLIEVKTTQFGAMTPFFASRNEVAISAAESDRYHVYRVFSFSKNTQLFQLSGSLSKTCELTPSIFVATPSIASTPLAESDG